MDLWTFGALCNYFLAVLKDTQDAQDLISSILMDVAYCIDRSCKSWVLSNKFVAGSYGFMVIGNSSVLPLI